MVTEPTRDQPTQETLPDNNGAMAEALGLDEAGASETLGIQPVEEPAPKPASEPAPLGDATRAFLLVEGFSNEQINDLHKAGTADRIAEKLSPKQDKIEEAPPPEEDFPFGDEEVDPKVAEYLKAQKSQIDALRKSLGSVQEDLAARQADRYSAWVDQSLETLTEFEAVLGKGATSALKPDSTEYANRKLVHDKMALLAEGYKAQKQPIPDGPTLAQQAAAIAFPNGPPPKPPKRYSGIKSPEPINRVTPAASGRNGDDLAIQWLEDAMRSGGLN